MIADEQRRMWKILVASSAVKPTDQLPGTRWQPWFPLCWWQLLSVRLLEAEPLADELAFANAL